MKQSIIVTHEDGSVAEGPVTPVVQVAFERHFKVGIAALADPATMRMEHMYWLAWQATTAGRQGRPEFDKWLETVADVEFDDGTDDGTDDGEEGDVPLDGTRRSGASLPSPSSPVPG